MGVPYLFQCVPVGCRATLGFMGIVSCHFFAHRNTIRDSTKEADVIPSYLSLMLEAYILVATFSLHVYADFSCLQPKIHYCPYILVE